MKIAKVEPFIFDAGWRSWTFVKVSTDDGIVGWGECSVNRAPFGVAGAVETSGPPRRSAIPGRRRALLGHGEADVSRARAA